ncbi:MAG: PEP-CTERM sorting domain-containing protein [Planctomycetota bacterium]
MGSPGAVPEPSALGLLAVAGVVAGGLRRKRS